MIVDYCVGFAPAETQIKAITEIVTSNAILPSLVKKAAAKKITDKIPVSSLHELVEGLAQMKQHKAITFINQAQSLSSAV